MMDDLSDEAYVVRGAKNRPVDMERVLATHPSGVTGVSVESAARVSVVSLCGTIPHGKVGVKVVGHVRRRGGDVISTSGRSPNHATLTGLSPDQISELLTPTILNPAHSGAKPRGD